MLVEAARRDLARYSRHGLGNVVASLLVWTGLSVLGLIVQQLALRAVIYLSVAMLLWPISLIVNRLLSRGTMRKDNVLFSLAGLVAAQNILFIPLLVETYLTAPHMMPLNLSVLLSAQFLLYVWIYNSLAYLFGSLGLLEIAVLITWLAPGVAYLATPIMVTGILVVTAIFLLGTTADDKQAINSS